MFARHGGQHRRTLRPVPAGGGREVSGQQDTCRQRHFAQSHLRCELPPGHAGAHEAGLPRGRRMRWSILQPL